MVDQRRSGQPVHIIEDLHTILITDPDGTILIEHTRPAPGTTYVSNGQPRGRRPQTSPMS